MMNITEFPKKHTLGIVLTTVSFQQALDKILERATKKEKGYFCFANAHMTVEAKKDADFTAVVNHAIAVFPDGMPLVWAMESLHGIKQDRIAGMDVFPALLKEAARQHLPVYFYGATSTVLKKIEDRAKALFPNLIIAGAFSPPFSNFTDEAQEQAIHNINYSGARLVFVALGCPKQEKWMAKYASKLHVPLLGVGGAFPVFAQQQQRAPIWMRKSGMEWLFRFLQEPQRLWKRYLFTNSYFLLLYVRALAKHVFRHFH